MAIITVDEQNIDQEHICCVLSDKKEENRIAAKKLWLKQQFNNGLVFKKLDVRGKVFIEYIPAEYAWYPITAPDYMHINCFWVSGQYKGQGYGNLLLEQCIADAKLKGKAGLTVLSSAKKMPYLSDPDYLTYKGFQVADTALPNYTLLYLPFRPAALPPRFNDCCRTGHIEDNGLVLYYHHQCPHTARYIPLIQEMAFAHKVPLTLIQLQSASQAQQAPCPYTAFSLYDQGQLVTHEIFSEKKFEQFLAEKGL